MRRVAHRAAHRARWTRAREDDATWTRRRARGAAATAATAARRKGTTTTTTTRVDGYTIGALLSWLRTHGVDVDRDATTVFGVSRTYGIGGVAVRDMDEGEVGRDGDGADVDVADAKRWADARAIANATRMMKD